MSTRPGMRNLPRPSIRVAPSATCVVAEGPLPMILSPSIETVVASSGARPVTSTTLAPTTASLWISLKDEITILLMSYATYPRSYQQVYPQQCITYMHPVARGRKRDSVPDRGDFPDHPKDRLGLGLLHRCDARQPDDELASVARALAVGLHLAAVKLHEPAYQGETDAEAALSVEESPIALRGQVEHVRKQLGRNPDAGVGDADGRAPLFADHTDSDRAARRGVLDRVQQEIREDLVEPGGIRVHPDRLSPHVDDMTLQPARARQVADRPLHAGREIQRLARQGDLAGGDVDDVEEIVDQPAEVRDLMADRLASAHGDVVVAADPVEDADRADDRGERVPELVPQHRQ